MLKAKEIDPLSNITGAVTMSVSFVNIWVSKQEFIMGTVTVTMPSSTLDRLNLKLSPSLKKEFDEKVPANKRSKTLRAMIRLYLDGAISPKVDKFIQDRTI